MRPGPRLHWLVAPLFLASGGALVASILTAAPLLPGLGLLLAAAGGVGWTVWRRATPAEQAVLRRRAGAGLVAGILATAAYDLSRYLLVTALNLSFQPFKAIPVFGKLLVGAWLSGPPVLAAGVAYHLVNGVGFAMAYGILWGERGWKAGLAWAFALELAMVSLYPGWLGLRALAEFASVSVLGHVAYGLVLGTVSQHRLRGEG